MWARFSLVSILIFAAFGCQLAQRRALTLVNERREKLAPLSRWTPLRCQLQVQLTQPAIEHYKQLYPREKKAIAAGAWNFSWMARETSCEVKAEGVPFEALKTQKGLLETALCTLLQVHYVNSPFDELKVSLEQVSLRDNQVAIRLSPEAEFGIFMPTDHFLVETRTKSRGTFKAVYAPNGHNWLPETLELRSGATVLALSGFVYDKPQEMGRRQLRSVELGVGDERPLKQAQLDFIGCERP